MVVILALGAQACFAQQVKYKVTKIFESAFGWNSTGYWGTTSNCRINDKGMVTWYRKTDRFVWTRESGMVAIPGQYQNHVGYRAFPAVKEDGSVLLGYEHKSFNNVFAWTPQTGVKLLYGNQHWGGPEQAFFDFNSKGDTLWGALDTLTLRASDGSSQTFNRTNRWTFSQESAWLTEGSVVVGSVPAVAKSNDYSGNLPLRWNAGHGAEVFPGLTTAKGGHVQSFSANGQMCGISGPGSNLISWIWSPGQNPVQLKSVRTQTLACGVNNAGTVVGETYNTGDGATFDGVIWFKPNQPVLADKLIEGSNNPHVIYLSDINNKGQIVGYMTDDTQKANMGWYFIGDPVEE